MCRGNLNATRAPLVDPPSIPDSHPRAARISFPSMTRRRNTPRGPGDFDYRPFIQAFQRLDARMQMIVLALVVVIGITAFFWYRAHPSAPQEQERPPQAQRQPDRAPVPYPIPLTPE